LADEKPLADMTLLVAQSRQRLSAALQQLQPRRLGIFTGVGTVVFVLGTALQWGLILVGAGKTASYLWQAVFSIELSFGLNKWLTWRDRNINLAGALAKWNAQRLALTVPNVVAYAWLVWLGMNWLLANVLITAGFTLVNYVGGNLWSFRAAHSARHRADRREPLAALADVARDNPALPDGRLPEISVVIPCKNNQRTIRATVDALIGQDYPALAEVICVGDIGDPTWQSLQDVTDPRLVILEHEEVAGKRGPAVKRDVGLRKAKGEILALADSDIIMDRDWLSRAVALLLAQRGGVVCGGMRSAHDSFWGRFVDNNALVAKTPRVPRSYYVTARNFGRRRRKPPITANAVMTREIYDDCPMNDTWSYGYEDYEWFWRIASAGRQILYAAGLTGAHHHRRSFRALAREYAASAQGCARFVRAYPDSPLARKRRRQAVVLPLAALATVGGAAAAAAAGYGIMVTGTILGVALGLTTRELVRSRRLEAVAYPLVGLTLGVLFTVGLGWRLAVRGQDALRPAEVENLANPEADGEPRSRRGVMAVAFLAVLVAGAAMRLWQLAGKPDWQFDEGIYADIAWNILRHGTLNEHITYGSHWVPFLYQPPVYLLALVRWFALLGPSIYHARILGVLCALGSLILTWRLIWRLHGPRAALFASPPIVFDGWLLFVQRVSYIENITLLLVVAAMLLYQRALESPSWHQFAIAGLAFGLAVCLKYTGLYVLPALLLCWLILRRDHRGHLILLGTALAVVVTEQVALVRLFDVPGHDWYIQQTLVQIGRVAGVSLSGGTLSSPAQLVHLLLAQYKVFLPSFVIALAALILAMGRLLYCYRERTVASLRPQALLFSWAVVGVVAFSFSSLRYPQYFALVLLPLYCLWWTELWRWKRGRAVKVALVILAVAAGLTSFWIRVGSNSDNVFAEVQQYAATRIPAHAVVIADQSVGDLISQPYCREQDTTPCLYHATYAITWVTYLQSTFKLGDPAFHLMMRGATKEWSHTGFNGTMTVWRLH